MRIHTITAVAVSAAALTLLHPAAARGAPAPELEYVYDVTVRRHYDFASPDAAVDYGHSICDRVGSGQGYPQVMGQVKNEVLPNDEFAANYLVSNAVNLLCPDLLWQLRNSAAHYQPPPGG